MSRLEGTYPGAVVRFDVRARDVTLVDANRRAMELLSTGLDDLCGAGFADRLFLDDAGLLAVALAGVLAAVEPDRPLVVRWGDRPPVAFVAMSLFDAGDGTVLAALHDRTDQYRLSGVLRACHTVALRFDGAGVVCWISPEAEQVLGDGAERSLGRHWSRLVHPDDHTEVGRAYLELQANPGRPVVAWHRVSDPRLPDRWWSVRTTFVSLPEEPAVGGIIVASKLVDPSDVRSSTHGPADMTVAEMTPSAVIMSGRDRLQYVNRLARSLLGPTVHDIDDAYAWVNVLRPRHRAEVHEALQAAATSGRNSSATAALDGVDGVTHWFRIEVRPSYDAVGTHIGYVATLLDVSAEHTARQEMERAQEELWQLANHDTLTGLPNRTRLVDRLEHALARTRREARPTAVLYCDLDDFKAVNDRFGHAGGDALLVEIGHRLRRTVRESDTVCRLGGDEFVVICEAFDDAEGIEALTRRLIAVVNEPVRLVGATATVGLCVGIAVATADSTTDELLARADAAVYEAKRAGRNGFVTAPGAPGIGSSRSAPQCPAPAADGSS